MPSSSAVEERGTFAVIVIAVAVLAGCAQQPDPNLYVMSPSQAAGGNVGNSGTEPVKAVLRVHLPEYLDRREIVSRSGANELVVNKDDRWAEPLDESVPRVLAENLSNHIPGARVVVPSEAVGEDVPYEYLVSLDAYEPDGKGNVVMRGRWHLRDERKGLVVAEGRIDEHRPLASNAAPEIVAALNESLNDAGRQIAESTVENVSR